MKCCTISSQSASEAEVRLELVLFTDVGNGTPSSILLSHIPVRRKFSGRLCWWKQETACGPTQVGVSSAWTPASTPICFLRGSMEGKKSTCLRLTHPARPFTVHSLCLLAKAHSWSLDLAQWFSTRDQTFAPQETFSNVWRYFWLSRGRGRWWVELRDTAKHSTQDSSPPQWLSGPEFQIGLPKLKTPLASQLCS